MSNPPQFSKYQGFTLIEVMISWLLLSIALLGLLATENQSLRTARASLYQSLAQTLLNNGWSIEAIGETSTKSLWVTELANALPAGKSQTLSEGVAELSWQLPEQKQQEKLRFHGLTRAA